MKKNKIDDRIFFKIDKKTKKELIYFANKRDMVGYSSYIRFALKEQIKKDKRNGKFD